MASRVCFVIGGFLLLIFTCQSAPIDSVNPRALVASPTSDQKPIVHEEILKPAEDEKSAAVSPTGSTTTTTLATSAAERNDLKQKRQIDLDAYPVLNDDEEDENEDEHILYTDVKESPANYEDSLDRLDDKNLYSDLQMNPAELSTILHQRRRRRDVQLMNPSNQRRKRSLSSYDLYSSDSFDDPWANYADEERYLRPLRSFAPIYWFPPVLDRSVRSFDRNVWPVEYVNPLVNDADDDEDDDDDDDDDDDENIPMMTYGQDNDDDESDYEPNRYPLLMKSYANPFDNLQLQTTYNTVDFPFDDNDDDVLTIIDENADDNDIYDDEGVPVIYEPVRPSFMRYDPLENFVEV